jgi:uncharacterized membrane protein YphA (DoxX/SURF4 family)
MKSKSLFNTLRVLLAVVFIFSAISKVISMPFFDGLVAEFLLGENYFDKPNALWWTQIFTRFVVGGELLLGIALLQNRALKNWVLPASILLLILFTVHLFFEGMANENGFVEGNCGCFGDVLPMTILESILKNIVGIGIAVYLWVSARKNGVPSLDSRFSAWVTGIVCLGTLLFGVKSYSLEEIDIPEIQVTTEDSTAVDSAKGLSQDTLALLSESVEKRESESDEVSKQEKEKAVKTTVEQETPKKTTTTSKPKETEKGPTKTVQILNQFGPHSDGKQANLEDGRKLVLMFSMTCSHCQDVYKDICQLSSYAEASIPQIYMYNFGRKFEQDYFFKQAGTCTHPFYRTEDYTAFKRMLEGEDFPRLLVLENGAIVQTWDVDSYSKTSFMEYFGIEEKKEEKDPLKLKGGGSFGW